MVAAALAAPELERAELGHLALERDRNDGTFGLALFLERHLERAQRLDVPAPVLDQRARRILLADGRREEAELGRLADRQPELASRDVGAGPFLHAERDDAERLERRREAGHRRERALDADVVAARRAAADAHALAAGADAAVVGGAARDGVIEIARLEHARAIERREAFPGQPR